MALLQEESELDEIVRLVGIDALSYRDRLTLECTRSIREDYLHQNAYHEVDTYSSPKKQYLLLRTILSFYEKSLVALQEDAPFSKLVSLPVREQIGRMKYVPENEIEARCDEISRQMSEQIRALTEG
jgi:V/A-type H+-transporting ATPase subunit A